MASSMKGSTSTLDRLLKEAEKESAKQYAALHSNSSMKYNPDEEKDNKKKKNNQSQASASTKKQPARNERVVSETKVEIPSLNVDKLIATDYKMSKDERKEAR